MKILKYEDIKNIFNKKIFENSRIDLLTKLHLASISYAILLVLV